MPSTGTIAVAYASIGSGHRTCAEGIAAELAGRDDAPRVELLDILDYAKPRLSGNRLTSTFAGPTAGLYDAAWGSAAAGSLSRAVSGPLFDLMFAGFLAALDKLAPSVVVCTHAAAAVMASRAKMRGRASWDVVNVTTDFGVHGYWPREGVSLFCVADERTADVLLERGFDESVIAVTGIPVRRQFAVEYDRAASLEHFGLPPDKRIVLALAGASLPGPYTRFKQSLAVALPAIASLPNTAVVVVTGKDEAFAEDMKSRAAGFGTTNVHVFGFVEYMAPLMACADLGLAKPGGAVCAESVASHLPLVLVGPAAGQEAANARALHEAGVAVYAPDPRQIAEATRKVIAKPPRLKAMRAAAEAIGRPHATSDVADRVLALARANT